MLEPPFVIALDLNSFASSRPFFLKIHLPWCPRRCVAFVLFQELGFRGAIDDEYYDPRNSFLDQVGPVPVRVHVVRRRNDVAI